MRETLDVLQWGTGKIEATPHGFFAKIMAQQKNAGANPGGATVDKRESKTYASHIPFDHYNVPKGKAVTDTEFPVGKRTKPPPLPDDFPRGARAARRPRSRAGAERPACRGCAM